MKILELVKNCKRIGISGHEKPDGDCAGACCGLALFLRKTLPYAQTDIYLDQLPEAISLSVPGADTVINDIPDETESYDAFIVLDSIPERTGKAAALYENSQVRINIDHHITNCGQENAFCYIDGKASSACELVYDVIDKDALDPEIAQALYVGIVTDTGVFQYSNTSESTMRVAGHLISFGFNFSKVIREVFFERSYVQSKILGAALNGSQLLMGGKVSISILDKGTVDRLGAERKDFEGISEQLLLTAGVDCSVFIHETKRGEWRVSMRSAGITNVSETARLLGGGGHIQAAGCTIYDNLESGVSVIKNDIEEQLKNAHLI